VSTLIGDPPNIMIGSTANVFIITLSEQIAKEQNNPSLAFSLASGLKKEPR